MIYIGNKYRISSDKYQFILGTSSESTKKPPAGSPQGTKGEDYLSWADTYHPNLDQIARKITTDSAMNGVHEAESMVDLLFMLDAAIGEISNLLNEVVK